MYSLNTKYSLGITYEYRQEQKASEHLSKCHVDFQKKKIEEISESEFVLRRSLPKDRTLTYMAESYPATLMISASLLAHAGLNQP